MTTDTYSDTETILKAGAVDDLGGPGRGGERRGAGRLAGRRGA
ncbi:hypothetical protein [Frankia sp. CcWB3]